MKMVRERERESCFEVVFVTSFRRRSNSCFWVWGQEMQREEFFLVKGEGRQADSVQRHGRCDQRLPSDDVADSPIWSDELCAADRCSDRYRKRLDW
jgi:hypothetical protein